MTPADRRRTFAACSRCQASEKGRAYKYDVLASVEKYEPYDFEYFVSEFGYEIYDEADANRVRKIYEACDKQYQRLLDLFGEDLMQELQEIN